MSKELFVSEVPEATCVVSHGINRARDVMMSDQVPMVSLVQRIELKEVRAGGNGGCRSLLLQPRHGRAVIARQPDRAFTDIGLVGKDVLMGDKGGQLKIRDRDRVAFIVGRDQGI